MAISPSGATVWRDYSTDGVPASGAHKVQKSQVRAWSQSVEDIVTAAATAALVFDTRANLYATLTAGANTLAWVVSDSTAAYNGIYRKSGASGTGSWSRVADLPYSFIVASDVGAGTANAIQATTSTPVSESALVLLNIFEANTGSPVTVSFNGGSALTIKTNTGNNVATGGLATGMLVLGRVSGSTFRIVNDQVSSAIVAQAEAWAEEAKDARDAALSAQPNAFPADIAALKLLPTSTVKSAHVKDGNNQYFWSDEDLSSEVTSDPDERRYVASGADPTGVSGAWVLAGSVPTGGFATNLANPPNVQRMTGRIFGGGHANFSGKWVGYSLLDGIDPLTRALHNWGPRDSSIWWDSEVGGITIAATSRTTEGENWPGYPTFVPSSIPLSGFVINDRSDGLGQGWAIYGDAVRFYGFTLAEELTVANFGSEVKLSLYNAAENGSNTSVISWLQSGAGLDAVEGDLANQGLSSANVGHISAFMRMLSSFSRSGATPYVGADPVAVGDKRIDGQTDVVYVCKVAHTTPSGPLFRDARAANPTYWKALPAAYAGIQFAAGALAEVSPGTNVFSALEMTERTQISWWRNNASNVAEQSAFIWADAIPDGTPAVGITLMEKGVYSASKFAGNADGTYGAKIQGRGNSGNHAISFAWTGTQIQVYVDNTLVKSI